MTSTHPNPQPRIPPGLFIGIGITLAGVGIFTAVRYLLDQHHYESAMRAYKKIDCDTAIEKLDKIIDSYRIMNIDINNYVARSEETKSECQYFQSAVNQQEKERFENALRNYITLFRVYDESALLDSARKQVTELFQSSKTDSVATENICNELNFLSDKNLIPTQNDSGMKLYLACGKGHEEEGNYRYARNIYEQFLTYYPNHTYKLEIERSLARVIVVGIEGKGAEEIEPPAIIGRTNDGSTVIEIENDSPRVMEITFSGFTPRFEELESCRNCIIHKHTADRDLVCNKKESVGQYTIEPGEYEVAIDLIEEGDEIIEYWVGRWNLEKGFRYSKCFYIVFNPIEEDDEENISEEVIEDANSLR